VATTPRQIIPAINTARGCGTLAMPRFSQFYHFAPNAPRIPLCEFQSSRPPTCVLIWPCPLISSDILGLKLTVGTKQGYFNKT